MVLAYIVWIYRYSERHKYYKFVEIESNSGVLPCIISDEKFCSMFYLVDGTYTQHSRFVKAVKQPILPEECQITKFQEVARKDIERVLGLF